MAKTFSSTSFGDHGKYEDDMKDWLDSQQMIKFKDVRSYTLRPVSPMLMMARHWPKSLQSGKDCPPMWCPKFSSETQKFDQAFACHLHDDFGDRWKAQKVVIFAAIVREWQEEGKKNPIGILVLPSTVVETIKQIVGINKYDIADPAKGCDLSVVYAKEAQATNRWSIQRTDRTPLTEDEMQFFEATSKVKVPALDRISPDFGDKKFFDEFTKATKKKLSNFSYYVTSKPDGGDGWAGYKKDVNGQPYTDFPELAEIVGDGKQGFGKQDSPSPRRRPEEENGKMVAKSRPADEDDDVPPAKLHRHHDVVDADEDTPPPKKTAAKRAPADDVEDAEYTEAAPVVAKKTKPKPEPVDDEDDDAASMLAAKARKAAKDEDAEPPFDVDEVKVKSKRAVCLPGAEDWADEHDIVWRIGAQGTSVPTCFGVFEGASKCKAPCPVRKGCKIADAAHA